MCGISNWVAMEEPELGTLADLIEDQDRSPTTVRVLSRHDAERFDVDMSVGYSDAMRHRIVHGSQLRPCSRGPVALTVFGDACEEHSTRYFPDEDAALAYGATLDQAVSIETVMA